MVDRKSFLLRVDPALLASLRRWAEDDLRSLNGQVEFLLRRALSDAGRLPKRSSRRQAKKTDEGDSQFES